MSSLLLLGFLIVSVGFLAPPIIAQTIVTPAQSDSPEPVVDSIVIDNRVIYDTSDPRYDHFIFRFANRLHIRTRQRIVAREVLLRVGEPFSQDLADETARNLRQRLRIYDAWVQTETLPNGRLLVRVVTVDQWSLSGGASIQREANEIDYWIGATNHNFLGLNQFVSATYYVEASEADHARATFADNRLFGQAARFAFDYSNDPRSRFTLVALSHPFYNLSQKMSVEAVVNDLGGRRDVYKGSSLDAQSDYNGFQLNLGWAYSRGTYRRKALFRLHYKYREEKTTDTTLFTSDPARVEEALRGFPVDSLYHEVRLSVGVANIHFIKLRRIDGFGYTEDFTLGSAASVNIARAMNPDSVVYHAMGVDLAQSSSFDGGLLIVVGTGRIWLHRDETLRRQLQIAAQYYNTAVDFVTLAMRVDYLADWRTARTDDIILGGRSGLRGFSRYFRTGDRRAVLNAEGRFFPNLELLSVLFGGAAFVDFGRTFETGESLSWNNFYASVGVGLRVSFERSSRTSLFRCDLAYSAHNGWQFSVSSGQYFNAARDVLALTSR